MQVLNQLRRAGNIISIKRTISQNYDKFRSLSIFFNERKEVLEKITALSDDEISKIAQECREGGVRWRAFPKYMNKIEGAILTGEVIDKSNDEEPAVEGILGKSIAELINIRETPCGVNVSFNTSGKFDIYAKANRNGVFEAAGMNITPETEFTLVNELNPFWEDRYSLAVKSDAVSFAISVEDPKTGKKGGACARIYVLENGVLTVDLLSKYMDTSALTLWIAP